MQDTRIYDYMIRSGIVECSYAGSEISVPVSIGITPRLKHGELAAHCVLSAENGGLRVRLLLDNDTGLPVTITSISLETTIHLPSGSSFFCNGYQSWSSSGMVTLDKGLRSPGILCPRIFRNSGDYSFVKYSKKAAHSWTYSYFDSPIGYTLISSLDESLTFTKIDFSPGVHQDGVKVNISKDCEGLILGPVSRISGIHQEPIKVLDVFMTTGNENDCWDRFFSLFYSLKKDEGIYNRSKPALVWDSSYAMLDRMDEMNLTAIAREYARSSIPLDYFIIGNGYEKAFGDWTETVEEFTPGMKRIADNIKATGSKPGITFSPFICSSSSHLYNERREILLKDARGKPVSAGYDRRLGGQLYVIDIYNPEGERYIKRCIKTFIDDWGMQIIRADMLYAAAMSGGRSHGRTRAQAMAHGLEILRRSAGNVPVIACAVPLGSAFGIVEHCSVAPDLSPNWNGSTDLRCRESLRERESTRNAVISAISRRHLDLRAFSSDIGSFTLRRYRGRLAVKEQLSLFKTCNIFSSFFTGSDSLGAYNASMLELYLSAVSSRPIRRGDRSSVEISNHDEGLKVRYNLHGTQLEETLEIVKNLDIF